MTRTTFCCLGTVVVTAICWWAPTDSAAQTPTGSDPAAAEEEAPRTGPLSGYMDFHFNKATGQDSVLDFHRFVLLFNHSFTPRIRFVGELELEHAFVEGLEEAGEIELEQAYLDFLISRAFNVRVARLTSGRIACTLPLNVVPGTAGLFACTLAPGRSSADWLSGTSALAQTVPRPLMRNSVAPDATVMPSRTINSVTTPPIGAEIVIRGCVRPLLSTRPICASLMPT